MSFLSVINGWIDSALNESWNWFAGLHIQEWFVVLGLAAAFGFLCMRGFSAEGHK